MDAAIARGLEELQHPATVANRHMLHVAEEPQERFLAYLAAFAPLQARRLHSADVLDTLEKVWMARRQRP
jgi:(3,5-dihydroxyphenyl)acetyl-CoA 1,2-dioxygenase